MGYRVGRMVCVVVCKEKERKRVCVGHGEALLLYRGGGWRVEVKYK